MKWLPIVDFPKYEVSETGLVRRNGRILKASESNKGYLFVRLTDSPRFKNAAIHRLVAKAFIPNPKNLPQVNHINSVKHDNRVNNLEWCTNQDNCKKFWQTHTMKPRTKQHTERQSLALRKAWANGKYKHRKPRHT